MANVLIRKLGVVVKKFIPEYYGSDLESDRLIAEWWLSHNRVEEKINGQRKPLQLAQYLDAETPILNPAHTIPDSTHIQPLTGTVAIPESNMILVQIPIDISGLTHSNHQLIHHWQAHIREIMLNMLAHGYVITDFLYENYQGQLSAFYLMSFDGPRLTFNL